MEKVIFGWSGGKDSSLALYKILSTKKYKVLALLTTATEGYDRISMHGVRNILLEQQAESIGLSVEKVIISKKATNKEYERKMRRVLEKYKKLGVSSVVFGDIFLEDIRKYREQNLKKIGMKGIFPL